MKREFDEALCRDFPAIFRNRYADNRTTCMCWGMDCEDGWEPLIRKLCEQMEYVAPGVVVADQVKEKYGTLRFYFHCEGATEIQHDILYACEMHAMSMSAQTCEVCGKYGGMESVGGSPYGWRKTLCAWHAEELGYAEIEDD